MTTPDRIVVVGGGLAGVSTVGALRSSGYDGELTLIDAGEFPYDRPPLSKAYLSGTTDATQIALRPADWYDDQRIRFLGRLTVSALSPSTGDVELSDRSRLPADRVVLATGGGAARPPIPGATNERVHVLRTLDDADRLRDAVAEGKRLLIVGGGLIGAEVASTAVELGCDVVLVDPVSPPLSATMGAELAAWLHAEHTAHGIEVVTASVVSIMPVAGGLAVRLDNDTERTVDAVLLAVGMTPETALAETAGLEVDRGIVVGDDLVTSNPAVLAAGDPVRIRTGTGLAPRTEHWEAASRHGERAAATLLGLAAPQHGAPWFWTDRHHRHIEAVGHIADAESIVSRGSLGEARLAVFGLRGDRLIAVAAVNDATSIRAGRRLIDRGVPVDPALLADPAVNLRKLLHGGALPMPRKD